MKLSERLKRLREAKGLTVYALAQAARLTPTHVKLIEDGINQNPKLETVVALSRGLGVDVGELVGPMIALAEEDAETLAPPVVPLEPEPAAAHSGASAEVEVRRPKSGEVSVQDAVRLVEESLSVFREALKKAAEGPKPLDPKPKSGVRKRFAK